MTVERATGGKRSAPVAAPPRLGYVDAVRGLAVACMVVDHLAAVLHGPAELRWTVGRLAVPLFFLTAGRFAGRLTHRHALGLVAGLALPLAVPWVDAPNVLVWWALGCALLAALRLAGWPPVLLVAVGLTAYANGVGGGPGTGYPPLALWALMGAGALLPVSSWSWGERLTAQPVLQWLGRHALGFYVGHAVLLTLLSSAWS